MPSASLNLIPPEMKSAWTAHQGIYEFTAPVIFAKSAGMQVERSFGLVPIFDTNG
jgi:hypothetical protein